SDEITYRLQSQHGDIHQEGTKRFTAGTRIEMATIIPLWTGAYHLALVPPAGLYFQKRLRFERKEIFHFVRTPYTHKASLNARERAEEALDAAAQRHQPNLYSEIAKMLLRRWDKVNSKVIQQTLDGIRQHHAGADVDRLGALGLL